MAAKMAIKRKWLESEVDYLRKHYSNQPSIKIAKKLNRSIHSINGKANLLGLKVNRALVYGWTEDELKKLKELYPIMNKKDIAKTLNKTEPQILSMGQELNLFSERYWSKKDTNFLFNNYKTLTVDELSKKLNRSKTAIKKKLAYHKLNHVNVTQCIDCERKIKYISTKPLRCKACFIKYFRPLRKKYQEHYNQEYYNKNREFVIKSTINYQKRNPEKVKLWTKKTLKNKKDKENKRRKLLGIPLIKECNYRLKEKEFKIYLDRIFPNELKLDNKRYNWLNNLELDRFYPSLKLAFEYNGKQHYKYVNWFYRKRNDLFKTIQERDRKKRKICQKLGIKLIVFSYNEKISEQSILEKIKDVSTNIVQKKLNEQEV